MAADTPDAPSFERLTEGVRRPSTWRESRALGWLAHSESSIRLWCGVVCVPLSLFYLACGSRGV